MFFACGSKVVSILWCAWLFALRANSQAQTIIQYHAAAG
jgi:hypothetical protein